MRAPKSLATLLFLAAILIAVLACGKTSTIAPHLSTPTSNAIPGIATGTQSAFARVDQYFRDLIRGTLVFTTPRTVQLKKPITVVVSLNPGETSPALEIPTPAETQVITGEVTMSPRMSADLDEMETGTFDIRPIHPNRVQEISSIQKTQWSWTVIPLRPGRHSLLLKLSYVLENGQENFLESYPAEVEVSVTPLQRLQMNWWWIAAFLVVALLIAMLWYSLRQRKQIDGQQSSEREGASRRQSKRTGLRMKGGNIFISYRRSDSADIAGRIYDRLIVDIDEDSVFKDVDSIPLGADFKKYLDVKVSECKALLAIIGAEWLECRDETGGRRLDDPGDFVRIEIESALKRGIPVIPLLVQGAGMPDKEDLPPTLQALVYQNGLSIRPDPDFHNDMDRLISALEKYIQ